MSKRKSLSSRSSRHSLSARTAGDPSVPTQSGPTASTVLAAPPSAADPLSVASSSKVTLDILERGPPPVEDSITHDYVPSQREPQELSDDDKQRLVAEVMGFSPFIVLRDISEHARNVIYPTVASVEGWAREVLPKTEEMEREIELGSVRLETLLEAHVDKAFDKFTAYALRNVFRVPDGVELVVPWQRDADYDRAKFVTELPNQEATLHDRMATLRHQVEQARLVRHRLAAAEAQLDRRLALLAKRRAQVGFVHDDLAEAGLAPLPDVASSIKGTVGGIHEQISTLEIPHVPYSSTTIAKDDGAWESGRQAYRAWATRRALGQDSSLTAVEKDTRTVGTQEDVAALVKVVK